MKLTLDFLLLNLCCTIEDLLELFQGRSATSDSIGYLFGRSDCVNINVSPVCGFRGTTQDLLKQMDFLSKSFD